MYEVADVLHRVDEHFATVIVLMLFGWVGGFVQIIEATRLGFTQRVAGQPLGTTIVMIAHDLTFSFQYQHYVHDVANPIWTWFWVGMVVSNVIEFTMLYQWARYQQSGLPTWAVCTIVATFMTFAFTAFWWVQSMIDDPLDLAGCVFVQMGAVVFGVPMLLGRGTARGCSRVFVWATLLGPGSLGYLFIPYLAPNIGTRWQFWAAIGATTACGVALVALYEYLRRADSRQPGRGTHALAG